MQIFHKLLEDIHHKLLEVEREKARWQPVPDVVLESLQDEIDTCKVRQCQDNAPLQSLKWAYNEIASLRKLLLLINLCDNIFIMFLYK